MRWTRTPKNSRTMKWIQILQIRILSQMRQKSTSNKKRYLHILRPHLTSASSINKCSPYKAIESADLSPNNNKIS
jgi:hypothetical protein